MCDEVHVDEIDFVVEVILPQCCPNHSQVLHCIVHYVNYVRVESKNENYLISLVQMFQISPILRVIVGVEVVSGFCCQLKELGNVVENCKCCRRYNVVKRRPIMGQLKCNNSIYKYIYTG